MSSAPGTRDWWIETALIVAGGVLLAIWLWDGPPAGPHDRVSDPRPRTLAELIDAGCLSVADLTDLREGRQVRVDCPGDETTPTLRDLPPSQRPFP